MVAAGVGSGAPHRARTGARAAGHGKRAAAARPAPPGAPSPAASAPGGGGRPAEVSRLISLGRPIYCAGRRGDEVALTFDDGPGPYTRLMLDKLRKHGLGATFFVVGRNIPLVPGAIRAERAIGAVGDHTFTHPLLTALPRAEAEAQIVHTQHALEVASGGPVFLFRPPYGAHDAVVDGIAKRHGLLEILWSIDSEDSLGADYARDRTQRDRGPQTGGDHPHAREPRSDDQGDARDLRGAATPAPARGQRPAAAQRRPAEPRPGAGGMERMRGLRRGQPVRGLVGRSAGQ